MTIRMPLSPALSPLVPRGEREKICRRAIAFAIAWGFAITSGALVSAADNAAPVVPGYVRLKDEAKAPTAEQGEVTQIDHPNGLITKPAYVSQEQSAAPERLAN